MSRLEEIINKSNDVVTKSFLVKEFKRIGLKAGDKILVHSKLSSFGFVCGGERTVVEALMEVITNEGTISMPAHSGDICDPIFWGNPPVPKEWFEKIREEMPAFDRENTKTYGMGLIAENFRTRLDVLRSYHPTVSFTSWGKEAEEITKEHTLENSLGEGSPLRKMYDLDFKVLLLGVDYDVNTMFHLSEYRAGNAEKTINASPIIENGERVFKSYEDIEFKTELFMFAGESFEEKHNVIKDKIGLSNIKLFSARECVDFGVEYFKNVNIY